MKPKTQRQSILFHFIKGGKLSAIEATKKQSIPSLSHCVCKVKWQSGTFG